MQPRSLSWYNKANEFKEGLLICSKFEKKKFKNSNFIFKFENARIYINSKKIILIK
jgi:hypothetical protein